MTTEHTDFADRPVHCPGCGVVFSTVPTSTASKSAVRRVEQAPSWSGPEAGIMLWTGVVAGNSWVPNQPPEPCYELNSATGELVNHLPCVLTYVDSMRVVYESPFQEGTTWDVWDHVPGRPDLVIHKRSADFAEIASALQAAGSDAFIYHGTWDFTYWLTDPERTFLTSSGNRAWVSFAEDGPAARVWQWGAIGNPARLFDRFISSYVNIEDFTNNRRRTSRAFSQLLGSLFVSAETTPCANKSIAVAGLVRNADVAGRSGVAVHPCRGRRRRRQPDARLGSTRHAARGCARGHAQFRRVGTIPCSSGGGPLRVTGRLAEDPANVVAHLFGVTKTGSLFHVPVRTSDINP
jgi:hypothetical protein